MALYTLSSLYLPSHQVCTVFRAGNNCFYTLQATNESQSISSPNYPDPYDSDCNCTWNLTAQAGFIIDLVFLDFSTESCCDRVLVSII